MIGTCTRLAVGLVFLAAATVSHAQDDGVAVLRESAAAIKALKGVTYKIKQTLDSPLGPSGSEGEVKLLHDDDGGKGGGRGFKSLVIGNSKSSKQVEAKFHTMIAGEWATWIDDAQKKVFERRALQRTDADRMAKSARILIPDFFTVPDPLATEMKAKKITVEGVGEVHGEVCHIVRVAQDERRFTTWFISSADHLPRKKEVRFSTGDKSAGMTVELWDVKSNPELKDADLEIALPDGYSKITDRGAEPLPAEPVTPLTPPANPGDPASVAPPPVPPPQPPAPPRGLKVGESAPAFELKGADGARVTLDSLGPTVRVLYFWGTTFAKSAQAGPIIQDVHDKLSGKGVKVLGIACREKADKDPQDAMKNRGLSFPLALGGDDTAKAYGVRGFPSVCVVGKDGKVAAFFSSVPSKDELTKAVEDANK
ncbi:MAG: TlpA family protein disulfide reductase [Phycisphaerae bacterium]|nr:TlpA family protein disulfide reductase [Phycisphaerae bacterium]